MGFIVGLFWYVLIGYVCWRAWPAVRADLRRLHLPRRPAGRYSGRGDL